MSRSKVGENTDNIGTTVLSEGSWDNFEGTGESLVGPLVDSFDGLGLLHESASKLHLDGSTTGAEAGVNDDVTGDTEGVLEVTLDLVKDILGGTSEKNGASLGVLALSHEGEVVVTDFLDLEVTAHGADIGLLELLGSVADSGTRASGASVVVGLSQTSEDSDVTLLEEVVLGSVGHTLLGDDDIGAHLKDGGASALNLNFLHGKSLFEIFGIGELHSGHRLSLLVLKGAIEEDDTGVLDLTAHIGVSDILVEHDSVKDNTVLNHATWDLLDLSVALGVDLDLVTIHAVNGTDGLDSEVDDKITPLGSELGANAGVDDLGEILVILHVDGNLRFETARSVFAPLASNYTYAHGFGHVVQVVEGLEVGADDDGGVNVTFKETLDGGEDLSSEDNDGGGTITDFFILSSGKLDHGFSSGVSNINLYEETVI